MVSQVRLAAALLEEPEENGTLDELNQQWKKHEQKISYQKEIAVGYVERISEYLRTQKCDYIWIGQNLKEFRDQNLFEHLETLRWNFGSEVYLEGYNMPSEAEIAKRRGWIYSHCQDVYEFAQLRWRLEKSEVKRYIQIVERWCDVAPISIKKRFENYSYSQLCELLPVPDELLSQFHENMTIKEIRELKKQLLKPVKKEDVAETVDVPEESEEQSDNEKAEVKNRLSTLWSKVCILYDRNPSEELREILNELRSICNSLRC